MTGRRLGRTIGINPSEPGALQFRGVVPWVGTMQLDAIQTRVGRPANLECR